MLTVSLLLILAALIVAGLFCWRGKPPLCWAVILLALALLLQHVPTSWLTG
jgi:hypothetical protein